MGRSIKQRTVPFKRHLRSVYRVTSFSLILLLAFSQLFKARADRRIIGYTSPQAVTTQTNEKDIRALEQGAPIERELAGGEAHSYSIKVAAGQFLGVIVEQRGIDVVVVLFDPDGKQLVEVDSPNGTVGPEPVSLLAKVAGSYRLEVRSLEKVAPAGRYVATIDTLREATQQDKTKDLAFLLGATKTEEERAALLAANKLLITVELAKQMALQGMNYFLQENVPQALTSYNLVLKLGEQLGDKKSIAAAYSGLGSVAELQANYDLAVEYGLKTVKLAEELGFSKAKMGQAFANLGHAYRFKGDLAKALESYQKSFENFEVAGEKTKMAEELNDLGLTQSMMGNPARAVEYLQKSSALLETIGNRRLQAHTLQILSEMYLTQGLYPQALGSSEKSLRLCKDLRNAECVLANLRDISQIHFSQGNYAEALESCQQGLRLAQAVNSPLHIAQLRLTMGTILRVQGDYKNATEALTEGARILGSLQDRLGHNAANDRFAIAGSLNTRGEIEAAQGNYEKAQELYQQSLNILERFVTKDRSIDSIALSIVPVFNNVGELYALQGKYQEAATYFEKSLAITERMGIEIGISYSLISLAGVHNSRGDNAKALELAERATAIARRINGREALWRARMVSGSAYRAMGQTTQARVALEEALAVVESLRTNFAGNEARATYFASLQEPFELYIDLLMQMHKQRPSDGNDVVALQTTERARARTLLEALSEARADIRQGVDPALLERETSLRQQLNARAEGQTRLLAAQTEGPMQKLTPAQSKEQSEALQKEIAALTAEYQQIQAQIRRSSPRYAALTQPAPLNLTEIQSQVLDADTLLLEYALGEERSYLWAVTQTSIKSFELPKRSEIETAVRRVYELLSDGKQWAESDTINAQYSDAAGRLSQMLLAPVATQLQKKRLVIVGDGALQYLPFGALPAPVSQAKVGVKSNRSLSNASRPPLIFEHEIVSLPSASTLAVLRRETANRATAPKSIAILADPVFSLEDERVKSALASNQGNVNREASNSATAQTTSDAQSSISRSLLERAFEFQPASWTDEKGRSGELRIRRLPFTRREAEGILAAAPASAGMKALDFRASRETATGSELAQYRIIHFATHGFLNSEHPELSGIVLSLVNEAGQPVDGFLRLHEIYNLNLPADMVVLSACQTALGKEIRGEGLVGLTRGFMYAGAPRVVASLWKVDDAATAELMKRFYEGMLVKKLRPAEALRAAKVEMWKQKRWQAPFYWAAFELQGEWK